MTKKERIELQKFMNKFTEFAERQHDYLRNLQELCRKHKLTVSCSPYENLKALEETSDKDIARSLYEAFLEVKGQQRLMTEYGEMLLRLDFWGK